MSWAEGFGEDFFVESKATNIQKIPTQSKNKKNSSSSFQEFWSVIQLIHHFLSPSQMWRRKKYLLSKNSTVWFSCDIIFSSILWRSKFLLQIQTYDMRGCLNYMVTLYLSPLRSSVSVPYTLNFHLTLTIFNHNLKYSRLGFLTEYYSSFILWGVCSLRQIKLFSVCACLEGSGWMAGRSVVGRGGGEGWVGWGSWGGGRAGWKLN